ncbi:cytochrome c [Microvirga sp. W0021]|uniref:Cytochrome c n=1 Tax=Hohaiivirga grylli TaxID=3133970 RepID=A0ABV0BNA1_9HYPH
MKHLSFPQLHKAVYTLGLLAGVLTTSSSAIAADDAYFETLQKGLYLTRAADCQACHTAPGGIPFAGGLNIKTPFGTMISPNLTPDVETGIGGWSDQQFLMAVKHGIRPNGRKIYPALPYNYYTKVTDEDALAIKAYLNSLQPVRNPVVANQLPFPFSIRYVVTGWNMFYFTPGDFKPNQNKSEEWNRGAYLVDGLGHCGACHTPRSILGGETSAYLQGTEIEGFTAPNITSDKRVGLGDWSVDDIVQYLKTGRNHITAATGPMAEVVNLSTQHLTDADLKAMAVYLKDLPGGGDKAPIPLAATDSVMKAGQAIYIDNCSACHASNGAGAYPIFPSLKGNAIVQSKSTATLRHVVLNGAKSAVTDTAPTAPAMPAYNWKLNDDQIAAVLTYIRNSWGNAAAPVSASEVKDTRSSLAVSH